MAIGAANVPLDLQADGLDASPKVAQKTMQVFIVSMPFPPWDSREVCYVVSVQDSGRGRLLKRSASLVGQVSRLWLV